MPKTLYNRGKRRLLRDQKLSTSSCHQLIGEKMRVASGSRRGDKPPLGSKLVTLICVEPKPGLGTMTTVRVSRGKDSYYEAQIPLSELTHPGRPTNRTHEYDKAAATLTNETPTHGCVHTGAAIAPCRADIEPSRVPYHLSGVRYAPKLPKPADRSFKAEEQRLAAGRFAARMSEKQAARARLATTPRIDRLKTTARTALERMKAAPSLREYEHWLAIRCFAIRQLRPLLRLV